MRTTLDIEEEVLKKLMKITGGKSRSKVVNNVLKEYIRRVKIEELRKLSGKLKLINNWRKLREMELDE